MIQKLRPSYPFLVIIFACTLVSGCSQGRIAQQHIASQRIEIQKGDMSHSGGTATVRKKYIPALDDPTTTNDESNDQPIGHLGTVTISAVNVSSGNSYALDADVDGSEVERIYFPKGGWLDFSDSDIDSSGNGEGTDEKGNQWEFEGFTNNSQTMGADDGTSEEQDEE